MFPYKVWYHEFFLFFSFGFLFFWIYHQDIYICGIFPTSRHDLRIPCFLRWSWMSRINQSIKKKLKMKYKSWVSFFIFEWGKGKDSLKDFGSCQFWLFIYLLTFSCQITDSQTYDTFWIRITWEDTINHYWSAHWVMMSNQIYKKNKQKKKIK